MNNLLAVARLHGGRIAFQTRGSASIDEAISTVEPILGDST